MCESFGKLDRFTGSNEDTPSNWPRRSVTGMFGRIGLFLAGSVPAPLRDGHYAGAAKLGRAQDEARFLELVENAAGATARLIAHDDWTDLGQLERGPSTGRMPDSTMLRRLRGSGPEIAVLSARLTPP